MFTQYPIARWKKIMMNSSTTSSHQGKEPNTDQPLSSPSDAVQPLNSQPSISEQNSQPSKSEQDSNRPIYTLSCPALPYAHHQHLARSTGQQLDRRDIGLQWQHNLHIITINAGHRPNQNCPCPQPPQDGTPRTGCREEATVQEVHQSGFRTYVATLYLILMLQLLFTMSIIVLFTFEPHIKQFVRSNVDLVWMALVIYISVVLGMVRSMGMRRNFPCNVISFIVETMAVSFLAGTISVFLDAKAVLMGVGLCAAVCFIVTIFSYCTKYDFISCCGFFSILGRIVIGFIIIAIFSMPKF